MDHPAGEEKKGEGPRPIPRDGKRGGRKGTFHLSERGGGFSILGKKFCLQQRSDSLGKKGGGKSPHFRWGEKVTLLNEEEGSATLFAGGRKERYLFFRREEGKLIGLTPEGGRSTSHFIRRGGKGTVCSSGKWEGKERGRTERGGGPTFEGERFWGGGGVGGGGGGETFLNLFEKRKREGGLRHAKKLVERKSDRGKRGGLCITRGREDPQNWGGRRGLFLWDEKKKKEGRKKGPSPC